MSSNSAGRYAAAFARLAERGEGAFCPFFVLGDPSLDVSIALIEAAVEAGADMIEVGLPFSDPVADGPVIQAAANRALAGGAKPRECLAALGAIRARFPDLPIGVLTYANLVVANGRDDFYAACAAAGVDSVLVADVPAFEAEPFADSARAHGVAPVLIAAPNTPEPTLARVAELSGGYTYCVARAGVTGAGETVRLSHQALLGRLKALGAPPPMIGFGVSEPEHVTAALGEGAA
ncbi:MAG: tryptophan synthase subunit alpha, partial [Caulobacteraceae bacterium]